MFGGWSGQPVPCWATPLGCGFTGRPDAESVEGFDDFMDGRVAARSQKSGYAARPVSQTRADCGFESMIGDSNHLRNGFRAARPATRAAVPGVQRPARVQPIPSTQYKGAPVVVPPAYKHAHAHHAADHGMYMTVDGRRYKIHTTPSNMGLGRDEYFYNTDDGKKWEVIRGREGHFMTRPGQHR